MTDRDCLAGARCTLAEGGNACIDPSTEACVFDSECPVGRFCLDGRCREQCITDRDCGGRWLRRAVDNVCCDPEEPCRDCPPGASCVARPDGSRACLDTATQTCVRNSDCEATDTSFVCAPDQRCRVECRVNQDCRFDAVCAEVMFEEPGSGAVMGQFCVDPLRPPSATDAGAGVDASNATDPRWMAEERPTPAEPWTGDKRFP